MTEGTTYTAYLTVEEAATLLGLSQRQMRMHVETQHLLTTSVSPRQEQPYGRRERLAMRDGAWGV